MMTLTDEQAQRVLDDIRDDDRQIAARQARAPLDLQEVQRRNEAAHQMVSGLCRRRREWILSIPARRDYDPDLVISASLRDVTRLLTHLDVVCNALLAYMEPAGDTPDELRKQAKEALAGMNWKPTA